MAFQNVNTNSAFADTQDKPKQPQAHILLAEDGEGLLEYLLKLAPGFQNPPFGETPRFLILLDLDMPRKDGREALREISPYSYDEFTEAICMIKRYWLDTVEFPSRGTWSTKQTSP